MSREGSHPAMRCFFSSRGVLIALLILFVGTSAVIVRGDEPPQSANPTAPDSQNAGAPGPESRFPVCPRTVSASEQPPLCAASLSVRSVTMGGTTTLYVELQNRNSGPPLPVNLSSSDPAATVPASVSVQTGRQDAIVVVRTHDVGAPTVVTITASRDDVVKTAMLSVTPSATLEWAGTPTPLLIRGQQGEGWVSLNGPAPPGGATVYLTSADPSAAQVPRTVIVPEDGSGAAFPISVPEHPHDRSVEITASDKYSSLTFVQEVVDVAIGSLTVEPVCESGESVKGTVSLDRTPRLPVKVFVQPSDPKLVAIFFFGTREEEIDRESNPAAEATLKDSKPQSFTVRSTGVDRPVSLTISASLTDPDEDRRQNPVTGGSTTKVPLLLRPVGSRATPDAETVPH